MNQRNGSQMISGSSFLQSGSENLMHASANASNVYQTDEKTPHFPMKQILRMETNWYTSPEEVTGAPSSCASDIYRLGVLLFELYCTFSSAEEKCGTMSNLRHRVLPPQLLLKWPKEASFCLWLLHPQPTSCPSSSMQFRQAWAVARNQVFTEMKEHEKRVWSVDYSVADPTLLANGSNDGSVKLWNINQEASAATIRTKANVCCVQFPSNSSNFLAFGSADHNIKKKKFWCLHL
ncbi:hypothetical protein POM88_012886 [Heracleum sosnowskyi]|uniref:Uncharacterized protein n=1 Tax=Heracleum sosnowskyi TaxID=360622 RepID=A0AAD8IXJ7_9APIA|nr:hypothetical protein POM88_012886 [Heracleum sosnowskyi]